MTWGRAQRWIWLSFLLLLSVDFRAGPATAMQANSTAEPSGSHVEPQRLAVAGETLLRSFLDSAELPDLHCPNFATNQTEAREFYRDFSGTLPWIERGKPTRQARAIIRMLENAEYKGLRPEDYDGPQWHGRLLQLEQSRGVQEANLVRFDVALTVSTMRYVSDLYFGRVNPHRLHFDLEIDHTKLDLSRFLEQKLVGSQDVEAALESVEPPFPVYHRTEAALRKYIELAGRGQGKLLPLPSRTVKPGAAYAGVPQLAKLLALLGDLPGKKQYAEGRYQGNLVDGVKHFQRRHGLEPDGLIGPRTLEALNTPLSRRVLQLQLALERMRWMPREFNRPPIVVNIPEFRLHADNDDDHWALSMRVVVGKAYQHQTPVFSSEIRSVIFRPYWNVPYSILQAELIPHVEKDPSYLVKNSYEIVDNAGKVVSEGIVNSEIMDQLRSGELRVRQRPGPKNALDSVKFDVPSPYDVYLHGTPATELFSRSRRDFSHGCIRVEDPVALAAWVLRGKPGWTEESIRAAMNGDKTFEVKLDKPIPILILYSTAVVMEDGEVCFFNDIYRQDAALERALAEGCPYDPSGETLTER
jgi:L,D-transpeptidase YcbB